MQTYLHSEEEEVASEYERVPSRIRRRNKTVETITVGLMWVNSVLMLLSMSLHGVMLGGLILAGAMAVVFQKQVNELLTNFEKKQRKYGINIYAILFAMLTVVFLVDFASAPAQAQFFQQAENWIRTTGFAGAPNSDTNTVIRNIFNILRILFLLYIAVSVVNVIQAVRRDEDWASASRTPLVVLTGVFAGDFLTTLIT